MVFFLLSLKCSHLIPVLFKMLTVPITVGKELDPVVFFTGVRSVLYFSDSSALQMGYVP